MRFSLVCFIAGALLLCLGTGVSHAQIEEGNRAWAQRAEVLEERLATPTRIEDAIRHYREALVVDPLSLEASWRLLRALHYAIDFTNMEDGEKDARVVEAVELASASNEALETVQGTDSDRAHLLFWSAIAWGTRAKRVGLLTIVREGAASRMHDYAEQSASLDPSVDQGGALRLLSRLHATLPRVPFVSGWVDRDKALALAERAYALDAAHPGNRLVLALTLLDRAPDRRNEASELLESVASAEARSEFLVEDMAIREQAREQLEELNEEAR